MILTAFSALLAMVVADPAEDRAKMAEAMGMPAEVGEQLFAREIPAEQAKAYVEASAPDPFVGAVRMTVRSSHRNDNRLILNSERDFRDPLNVGIYIDEDGMKMLDRHFGGVTETILADRTIVVAGVLAEVPTGRNGQFTQLRMVIVSPYQIEIQ
ncbi:hypothetical protein [Sphingomicrobium sediminis]|uniref:Uncharacterized protein n=1 Tax=Sphingomicrobium sediminis TaxID=2950949 RepID=A0A9X2EEN8_9SPHN|nr:hypothetical protein [Sphingomicrobium sediminis]MCM8556548.1 hypothetical protein [Sphingomicrobium sediminis]